MIILILMMKYVNIKTPKGKELDENVSHDGNESDTNQTDEKLVPLPQFNFIQFSPNFLSFKS